MGNTVGNIIWTYLFSSLLNMIGGLLDPSDYFLNLSFRGPCIVFSKFI